MRKALIISSVIALFTASAVKAQISFGPEIGANFSSVNISGLNFTPDYTSKKGIRAGVIADIKLFWKFSLQPGVFYSMKGFDYTGNVPSAGTLANDVRLNYVEVPINLQRRIVGLPKIGHVFLGAGPCFSYGLNGTWKHSFLGQTGEEDIKFGNSTSSDIKSMDVGVNFNTGVKLNLGVFLRLQYGLGFTDLDPSGFGTAKSKNFSVSAGWLF